MTKHKKRIIIIVALIIALPVVGFAVFVGTKILPIMLDTEIPDYVLNADDSDKFADEAEKITTELIAYKSDTNLYTKIDIHRENGIPRFGIITDNKGHIMDTVWYVSNDIPRYKSVFTGPEWTDTSLTFWWEETPFNIVVVDALTGQIVIDSAFKGQPTSMFEDGMPTTMLAYNNPFGEVVDTIKAGGTNATYLREPKEDNQGITFSYKKIPNGLHFIYVKYDNKVVCMETVTKGVKRIRHTDSNPNHNTHTRYRA